MLFLFLLYMSFYHKTVIKYYLEAQILIVTTPI
jgi:hypothetical protein